MRTICLLFYSPHNIWMSAHATNPAAGREKPEQSRKLSGTHISPPSQLQSLAPRQHLISWICLQRGLYPHSFSVLTRIISKLTCVHFFYYARSLLLLSLLPGEVPTTTWWLLLGGGHLKDACYHSQIYISVERRLMGPLSIRRTAGKFTWTFCGIIRKENRRNLPLTVRCATNI